MDDITSIRNKLEELLTQAQHDEVFDFLKTHLHEKSFWRRALNEHLANYKKAYYAHLNKDISWTEFQSTLAKSTTFLFDLIRALSITDLKNGQHLPVIPLPFPFAPVAGNNGKVTITKKIKFALLGCLTVFAIIMSTTVDIVPPHDTPPNPVPPIDSLRKDSSGTQMGSLLW